MRLKAGKFDRAVSLPLLVRLRRSPILSSGVCQLLVVFACCLCSYLAFEAGLCSYLAFEAGQGLRDATPR